MTNQKKQRRIFAGLERHLLPNPGRKRQGLPDSYNSQSQGQSMDARTLFFGCIAALSVQVAGGIVAAGAERHQTTNFLVTAADESVARKVAEAAEHYRRELAVYWLGKPMPAWSRPCRISVNVGALGAGGQTTFQFVNGEVLNWRMSVQGSLERILDSVIPHEVNHTIFACHFRRPLPRWADEGAATLFEHESEKLKQLHLLNQVIRDRGQHFSLSELLSMKDYPQDPQRMLTLYAQGYTLVDFLVQQKGRHVYLELLGAAEKQGWEEAIRAHFDHEGIAALERNWRGWVLAGRPRLLQAGASLLATADSSTTPADKTAAKRDAGGVRSQVLVRGRSVKAQEVVRSQSPDAPSADAKSTAAEVTPERARGARTFPERAANTGFRSASFVAPVPNNASIRPRTGSGAKEKHLEDSGNTGKGWFDETRPDQGSTEAARTRKTESAAGAAGKVQSGRHSAVRGKGFVSTGHVVSEESGSIPIAADGTPEWAGFPGTHRFF
jgi:hypothetical protein